MITPIQMSSILPHRADTAHRAAKVAGPVLLPDRAARRTRSNKGGGRAGRGRFTAQRTMPAAILVPGHQVDRSAEGAVLINVSQ